MNIPWKIDMRGKVAVVTGGSGVLGSTFSQALASANARVAVLYNSSPEAAEKVVAAIVKDGGEARAYRCNVLDREDTERCHQQILADLGPCDYLLNGAGGNRPQANTAKDYFDPADLDGGAKTFFDLEQKDIEFVFNLNFAGILIPSQVFAKDMIGRAGCSIVNISSMNAYTPLTRIPAYSGAKAAVSNFTQWLAVYFSKVGIRVNAIAPGFFSTKQNASLLWKENGEPTARTEKILAATPMERFGESEELLGALLFLFDASAASFVTGAVIPVDGGYHAYSGV